MKVIRTAQAQMIIRASIFSAVMISALGATGRPTSAPTTSQKGAADTLILVMASWLDVSDLKDNEMHRVLPGPGGLPIRLSNGEDERSQTFTQNDVFHTPPSQGRAIESKGTVRFKGYKLPINVEFKFEYRDNQGRHYVAKKSFIMLNKSEEQAIRTEDGKAILLVKWQSIPVVEPVKKENGFQHAPARLVTSTKAQ